MISERRWKNILPLYSFDARVSQGGICGISHCFSPLRLHARSLSWQSRKDSLLLTEYALDSRHLIVLCEWKSCAVMASQTPAVVMDK